MQLAKLASLETGLPISSIMLLRHSNESVAVLTNCGASIQEYTAIQPVGSKYDFHRDPARSISAVIVVVNDEVNALYKVVGVESSGTNYELATPQYAQFDRMRMKQPRHCHKFKLVPLPFSALGMPVRGWEHRTRTPVQRSTDSFFNEITVEVQFSAALEQADELEATFAEQVRESLRSSASDRARRLANANGVAKRVQVRAFAFVRNPDVVAEVLLRAGGYCERCRKPAPFKRKSDQSPYLEVHHRVPLAVGGLDLVANSEALCPNCHREAHHGDA